MRNPDRRQFLAGAAGIVFTTCGGLRAQSHVVGRGRRVTVGGRRVKTVDFHAHCGVPEAMELMGRRLQPQDPLVMGPNRLAAMDQQGIDVQALSINPYWYSAERDLVRQIITIQNEKLSALCGAQPDRFVAFASVALQYPELAAEQLELAVKKLGLRGAAIGGNVNGEELSLPKYHPFWAKAEELGVPVLIHPQANSQGIPDLQKRLRGNGLLNNVIGNPLETTIALSHLIFEGTLDRFPALKICAVHGGGFLPSYAGRSDHGCLTFPAECDPTPLKKHPSEYLRQLYFDALVFTPEGLRHLVAECGASQIVLGTDYPFPWTNTPVDHVLATPSLNNAERRAILGETACKLLKIPMV
jgi:aminocarboxymuconate-semialdehyde decarboxylase